jgi:multidrug efflux pump subunit AcrA (membrane-fusion protein)
MKRKKIIILAIVVVAIGAGTFWYFKSQKTAEAITYKTAAATKGTLISTVSGSGNITVSSSANVSPSISGTVTGLSVAVGDKVTKGQTLFKITNDELDLAVSQAYTALLQAKQKLTQAKSDLTTAEEDYNDVKDTAISEAQLAYDQSRQALAQAKVQLEKDETTREQYEDENDAHTGTHSAVELAAAEAQVNLDTTTVESKEKEVAGVKSNLDKANDGTSDEIEKAKTKVSDAKISVQIAENDVKSSEMDYETQKETAAERTVTAPIDGTIGEINVGNGDELGSGSTGQTGTTGSSSTSIVIQDLTSLKAVVDINEVDIASVKVDQKVSMTFDAISDLTLTGKVEKVDTLGTSTQGVVTYSATIGFDSLDERVRPEMSMNAVITIDTKQDALIVSSSAVKTSGETSYVEILESGSPVQYTVETGATNDTQTEIVSGISEGAEVITQTITASDNEEDSSSSSSSTAGFGTVRMLESGTSGGGMPPGGM